MPDEYEVEPCPAPTPLSTITLLTPRRASSNWMLDPMMPAPMMATSAVTERLGDPPAVSPSPGVELESEGEEVKARRGAAQCRTNTARCVVDGGRVDANRVRADEARPFVKRADAAMTTRKLQITQTRPNQRTGASRFCHPVQPARKGFSTGSGHRCKHPPQPTNHVARSGTQCRRYRCRYRSANRACFRTYGF